MGSIESDSYISCSFDSGGSIFYRNLRVKVTVNAGEMKRF